MSKRPYSRAKAGVKEMTSIRLDPATKGVWEEINELLAENEFSRKSQSEIIDIGSRIYLRDLRDFLQFEREKEDES